MALYSTFSLLPPPPRHALSTLPEQERGRLPDFLQQADPAEALRHWTRRLYYVDMSEFWVHLWLCTGITLSLMLFGALAVMVPRIRAKTFWLMRAYRKPEGLLWVPNSMMIFTLCGFIWGILMVVQTSLQYRWFEYGDEPTTFWLLLLLCWLPMSTSTPMATLSLYHSSSPRSSFIARRQSGVCSKALVFNVIVLSLPLLQAPTVIVPASIVHRKYIKSLRMYEAWQIKYATQTELSQDMLIDAQRCWYALYPTFHWASLTFFIWAVWFSLYFVFYLVLSGRLVCVLRAQLKRSRNRPATQLDAQVSPPFVSAPLHNVDTEAAFPNGSENTTFSGQGSLEPLQGNPFSPKSRIVRRRARRVDSRDQLRYLRVVMQNVVLQMIGPGTALFLYCFLSAYAAATLPGSIETTQIKAPWLTCLKMPILMAAYVAIFAGAVFFLSIAQRGHDPEPAATELRDAGRGRHARKISRRLSRASGAGHRGAEAEQDGGNMTTFFESETLHKNAIERPALVITTDSTQHGTGDLEPSSPFQGFDLDVGGHRRFSQTIIIFEEPECVESVRNLSPNENSSSSASPRSARFAPLPHSVSGTTISPEDSGSRARVHSESSFTPPSPLHRMRSLSQSLRFAKPA